MIGKAWHHTKKDLIPETVADQMIGQNGIRHIKIEIVDNKISFVQIWVLI